MTLSDFKIQERAAGNWIYAGLLLVRLIIIFVILPKVKQIIFFFLLQLMLLSFQALLFTH